MTSHNTSSEDSLQMALYTNSNLGIQKMPLTPHLSIQTEQQNKDVDKQIVTTEHDKRLITTTIETGQ